MMWIRSSFAKMLSLTHVMFSEAEMLEATPNKKVFNPPSTTKKPLLKQEEPKTFPETTDFKSSCTDIVSLNADPSIAVLVVRMMKDSSWSPVYVKSSVEKAASSIDKSTLSHPQCSTTSTSVWPFTLWSQVEICLNKHLTQQSKRYDIHFEQSLDSGGTCGKEGSGKKQLSNKPRNVSQCYISTVTNTISLVVMRGADQKKRKLSDNDISKFMEYSVPKLIPWNMLGVDIILSAKASLASNTNESSHPRDIATLKKHFLLSLWDESEWSETKQKQLLNTLGLRKNSPVIAPLKSPYVKRQLGEMGRRRKKPKSTMNHGHLALFLGAELSQLI
jgi:hypothetical protein